MLTAKFIIENSEIVKKDLKKRGEVEKIPWVDEFVGKHSKWLEVKQDSEKLRHRRNVVSEEINALKKQGGNFFSKVKEMKSVADTIKRLDAEKAELERQILHYQMRIPNITHASVPIGKDSTKNQVVRKWGKIPKFSFPLKDHGQAIEDLNVADFERASKVSGSGFVYIKNGLALLDMALQRFAVDFLLRKKFNLVEPPLMLRREAYEGVVSLDDFENVMYKLDKEDSYLIATSEHSLVAMHSNEVIDVETPLKYAGISVNFRKEIGSHGVDTRGLFRMHQFNKVEQVVFCHPSDSWKIHDEIQGNAEEMLQKLKLPYRVVNCCTGDLGPIAAKKYDIEAYYPRTRKYEEVTSCSNCTSYQAARLNIRYQKGDDKGFVHTLNATGIATSRTMRAIIENYQQKDGSIKVPSALVKYMNGMKVIK